MTGPSTAATLSFSILPVNTKIKGSRMHNEEFQSILYDISMKELQLKFCKLCKLIISFWKEVDMKRYIEIYPLIVKWS